MTSMDRRTFLQSLAGAGVSAAFPESIRNALAIEPNIVTGTLQDVQHIVILMQENRSFDHYFGTLRGVRGFSDPRAVRLYGTGKSVFEQPNQNSAGSASCLTPGGTPTNAGTTGATTSGPGRRTARTRWRT